MTLVCFHPELGIIITGSEDGTVRVWHSTTYRLENTLNYGLERVWAVGYMKISRRVVIGYDEGIIMIKIGKEVPVASMDNSVKIIWANHSEITDGEQLSLAVKDLGSCDLYPQSLKHILSGRFVVVCGDGEYIIYTTLAWRNRSVWSVDGEYAVKESTSRIQVTTLFYLDWPIYLLGYLANQSRECVIEKEFNVTGYTLLLSMIQYKTLVMRRGLERASQVLPSIPKHLYSEARFLESREMLEDALEVATDMEDPFADPTEDFFYDGPVMGTLIMGSRAPDDVGVVSCDSRTSTSRLSIHGWVINSGPITITTDPDEKEHGVVQERIYKKYFIKEHYVIILAGPLDLSNRIIRVLEVAAVERIVSNLTVDIDYLSEVLNKEMDRRSRLEKGCIVKLCSFILVALTKDKKLMMRAFGFKHGNKNSGKLDITTSWCGGSPSKVKAREVLKKEMMISKTIRQIYHSHHMAMLAGAEAAEKDQKSIGGNHTIIVVSVVDGKLKTLTKSMVIDKYYRQFEFDLK